MSDQCLFCGIVTGSYPDLPWEPGVPGEKDALAGVGARLCSALA